MKKDISIKFHNALLSAQQMKTVLGGNVNCTVTGSVGDGCSCTKAPSGCETVSCKDGYKKDVPGTGCLTSAGSGGTSASAIRS